MWKQCTLLILYEVCCKQGKITRQYVSAHTTHQNILVCITNHQNEN